MIVEIVLPVVDRRSSVVCSTLFGQSPKRYWKPLMKLKGSLTGAVVVFFFPLLILAGCSIKQEITRLESKPRNVCIVEHKAVREGILEALQDGFQAHGISTRVISGSYMLKHNSWQPTWSIGDTQGCDAVTLYVANWTWDVTIYMYFASIWMVSPDGSRRLAQATYDSSGGSGRPDKFIQARAKILELVDRLIGTDVNSNEQAARPENVIKPVSTPHSENQPKELNSSAASAQQLRELKKLKDEGILTEEEFRKKKQAILDKM